MPAPRSASRLIAPLLLGLACAGTAAPLAASGCASAPQPAPSASVADLLVGHFTSAAQAREDPEFLEVHLHMVRIWEDRADGPWIYVEQAMATALDKPYRQRIYRLVPRHDGGAPRVESRVYELPNAAERVGAWADPARFAGDAPEALVAREGCTIVLAAAEGGAWTGSTIGDLCKSSLRGATYATSEVHLAADRLRTWDRGYDASGAQVWGAKKGPYAFDRIRPVPSR